MKPASRRHTAPPSRARHAADYPLKHSIGAAIRLAHRAMIQELQYHLAPYDIPVGMWFFLRALWEEEGLSQRELSERAGAMDPTTVEQLQVMERRGLIERRRSKDDRRKVLVYLTPRGRALGRQIQRFARTVNEVALAGLTEGEIGFLRLVLDRVSANFSARRAARSGPGAAQASRRARAQVAPKP